MYKTISDIPEEIRNVIEEYNLAISEQREMLKQAERKCKKIEKQMKEFIDKDMRPLQLDNQHNLDILVDHYEHLYSGTVILRRRREFVDRLTRDVEDYEDYIELYMKDNGFDMDSRDMDEELYEFIHQSDRDWSNNVDNDPEEEDDDNDSEDEDEDEDSHSCTCSIESENGKR